jgi:NADH:ubiquinone oxidoreductase subunit 6 (subunit J)
VNWTGVVFGVSIALALIGGVGAAFAQRPRASVYCLAIAMLGIAGICLALGNDLLAILVATVLGAGVPSAFLVALLLAPAPEPDVHAERGRVLVTLAGITAGFAALGWLLSRTPWLPAGGTRQNAIEWLGSRFLTDHLLTLDLLAALLATAALGAVALLRGRSRRA